MSIFDRFRKKPKDKVKEHVDEMSFEDEFDNLEDFSIDFQETDDRKPVTQILGGIQDGIKNNISNPETYEKVIRATLTGESSADESFVRVKDEIVDQVKEELHQIKKPLEGIFRIAAEKTKKYADQDGKLLSKIHHKLTDLAGQNEQQRREESAEEKLDNYSSSQVQIMLQEVFSANKQTAEVNLEKEQGLAEEEQAQEERRHLTVAGYLSNIQELTQDSVKYQYDYTQRYYQKSLELQLRSVIIQKELYRIASKESETTRVLLTAIKKNTSLPDYQKYYGSEYLGDIAKRGLIADIRTALTNTLGMKERIKRAIGHTFIKDVKDMSSAVGGMADMVQSGMPGASAGGMAGSLIADQMTRLVTDLIPSKLKDKIAQNPALNEKLGLTRNLFTNPASAIGELYRRISGKEEPTGMMGKAVGFLQDVFSKNNDLKDISLGNLNGNLEDAVPFNKRTQLSIVEVIPGLLTKIHTDTSTITDIIREINKDKVDHLPQRGPLAFNYKTSEFEDQESVVKGHLTEIEKKLNNLSFATAGYFRELERILPDEAKGQLDDETKRFLASLAQDDKVYYNEKGIKASKVYQGLTDEQKAKMDAFIQTALKDQETANKFEKASAGLRSDYNLYQRFLFDPDTLKDSNVRQALERTGLITRTEKDGVIAPNLALSQLSRIGIDRYLSGQVPEELYLTEEERKAEEARKRAEATRRNIGDRIYNAGRTAVNAVREEGVTGTVQYVGRQAKEKATKAAEKTKTAARSALDQVSQMQVGERTVGDIAQQAADNVRQRGAVGTIQYVGQRAKGAARSALDQVSQMQVGERTVGDIAQQAADNVRQRGAVGTIQYVGRQAKEKAAKATEQAKTATRSAVDQIAQVHVGERTVGDIAQQVATSAKQTRDQILTHKTMGDLVQSTTQGVKTRYTRAKDRVANTQIDGQTVGEHVKQGTQKVQQTLNDVAETRVLGDTIGAHLTRASNSAATVAQQAKQTVQDTANKVLDTEVQGKSLRDRGTEAVNRVLDTKIAGKTLKERYELLMNAFTDHCKEAEERFMAIPIKNGRATATLNARRKAFQRELLDKRKVIEEELAIFIREGRSDKIDEAKYRITQLYDQYSTEFIKLLDAHGVISDDENKPTVASKVQDVFSSFRKPFSKPKPETETPEPSTESLSSTTSASSTPVATPTTPSAPASEEPRKQSLWGRLKGVFNKEIEPAPPEPTSRKPGLLETLGGLFRRDPNPNDAQPETVRVEETPEEEKLRISTLQAQEEQKTANGKIIEILTMLSDKFTSVVKNTEKLSKGPEEVRKDSWKDRLSGLTRVGSSQKDKAGKDGDKKKSGNPFHNLMMMLATSLGGMMFGLMKNLMLGPFMFLLRRIAGPMIFAAGKFILTSVVPSLGRALLTGIVRFLPNLISVTKGIFKPVGSALMKGAGYVFGLMKGAIVGMATKVGTMMSGLAGNIGKMLTTIAPRLAPAVAGLGSNIVAGATALASKAGTALTLGRTAAAVAMASNPVGWGVAAATVLGTAAYFTYKYFKKRSEKSKEFDTIRVLQYGFLNEEKYDVYRDRLMALENYLEDGKVDFGEGNKPKLKEGSTNFNEILSILKVEDTDKDTVERVNAWYSRRFLPTFFMHLKALRDVDKGVKLEDLHNLKDNKLLDYLRAIYMDPQIFSVNITPFREYKDLITDSKVVKTYVDKLIERYMKNTGTTPAQDNQKAAAQAQNEEEARKKAANDKIIQERLAAIKAQNEAAANKPALGNIESLPPPGAGPNTITSMANNQDKNAAAGVTNLPYSPQYLQDRSANGNNPQSGYSNAGQRQYGGQGGYAGSVGTTSSAPVPNTKELINKAANVKPKGRYTAPPEVLRIIEEGGQRSGMDPNVLKVFAAQESRFNPNAAASTSSAKGLFQFINSTWQEVMGKYASKYNLPRNTSPFDPYASTVMASEYLKGNMKIISKVKPMSDINIADLYLTHFLGPGGALQFLRGMSQNSKQIAAAVMPAAAKANYNVFYDKDQGGRPRTMEEVYQWAAAKMFAHAKSYGIPLKGQGDPTTTPTPASQTANTDKQTIQSAANDVAPPATALGTGQPGASQPGADQPSTAANTAPGLPGQSNATSPNTQFQNGQGNQNNAPPHRSIIEPGSGGAAPSEMAGPPQSKQTAPSGFQGSANGSFTPTPGLNTGERPQLPTMTNTPATNGYASSINAVSGANNASQFQMSRPTTIQQPLPGRLEEVDLLSRNFKDSFSSSMSNTNQILTQSLQVQHGMSSTLREILQEVRAAKTGQAPSAPAPAPQMPNMDQVKLPKFNNKSFLNTDRPSDIVVNLGRTQPSVQ